MTYNLGRMEYLDPMAKLYSYTFSSFFTMRIQTGVQKMDKWVNIYSTRDSKLG